MLPAHVPDDNQALLLCAALDAPDAARAAFEAWQARTGLDTASIDEGSVRLLPLVYASLARIDPAMSGLARLKGWHRRAWLENTRLMHAAKPAVRALLDAGHRVMVFKGTALTLRYYEDNGARSMKDVDLLVPDSQVFDALAVLERLGWVSHEAGCDVRDLLRRHHAANLAHPGGGRLDLHRRLLADSTQNADGPLWERAGRAKLGDAPVETPCAADELLLACVHGWQWQPVPPIRWIADAVTIVRHMRAEDDWSRLIGEARRRQVSFRVSRALRVLVDRFGAGVPGDVLAALEAGPFAAFEAAEERNHTRPPGLLPPGLARAYFAHAREHGPPGGARWWLGCARRFRDTSTAPSGLALVPWTWHWARRRVRAGTSPGRASATS